MRKWTYTNNIHNRILVNGEKFRLNTAYDNIFQLFQNIEKKPTYDTFFATIIFEKDYARFNHAIKDYTTADCMDLLNHIMREYIIDDIAENRKKVTDIYKDSELVFASFYYDYGISLIEKKGKMTWKEFLILYSNLSEKSPLGKAITLCNTPDKELSAEGKKEKRKRNKMLNDEINIDSQLDNFTSFLKATAKR